MTTQTETIKMREALERIKSAARNIGTECRSIYLEAGTALYATREPQAAPEPVAREVARRTQFTYDELALGIELRGQVGIELARHPPSLCLADWRGFAKQVCDLFNKPIVTAPQAAPVSDEAVIQAADARAALYDDDDRQDIKTDVVNAFYAGVAFVTRTATPEGYVSGSLNSMLWLYRRLPRCYGRPPFIEHSIKALGAQAGIDVAEFLDERDVEPSAPEKQG